MDPLNVSSRRKESLLEMKLGNLKQIQNRINQNRYFIEVEVDLEDKLSTWNHS